jgi:hypothetical protein
MADAKKCDRCGNLYENYDGVEYYEDLSAFGELVKFDEMRLVRADGCGFRHFDLCPDCMTALISFIKQGEKKC